MSSPSSMGTPGSLLEAGERAFAAGDNEGARGLFARALELEPEPSIAAECCSNLGVALAVQGHVAEAVAWLREALRIVPFSSDAAENLVRLWESHAEPFPRRPALASSAAADAARRQPATPPRLGELPRVTALMTAYNYERYIAEAIESVLSQTYPEGLLHLVVVDDGSTDATAGVIRDLQRRQPGRITLVTQPNRGLTAATQAAIDAADSELLAICDADDRWLPDKVADQVLVLLARPSVSLVYGDMDIIDANGAVTSDSFFREHGLTPRSGRVIDDLAKLNFTTNSTLMWRGELPPVTGPYADYWIAMNAAAAGDVFGIPEVLSQYRFHDANMSFGATATLGANAGRVLANMQREIDCRRLILSGPAGDAVSTTALVESVLRLEAAAAELVKASPRALVEPARVTDGQRAEAAALSASLASDPERGIEAQIRGYARAFLLNPYDGEALRQLLRVAGVG